MLKNTQLLIFALLLLLASLVMGMSNANAQGDTTPPTATFSAPSSVAMDGFIMDIAFNEPATLTNDPVVEVNGGTYLIFTDNEASTSYLAITADGTGDITITLPVGSFEDTAGNANTVEFEHTVRHDITPPVVTITAPATVTDFAFDVMVSVDEPVKGFLISAIEVKKGTFTIADDVVVTDMMTTSMSFVLTITPDGLGDIEIEIAADAATDDVDNKSAAVTKTIPYFPLPRVTEFTGPDLVTGFDSFEVMVAINDSFFLNAGLIQVTNGMQTGFEVTNAVTFIITIEPNGEGEITITLPAGILRDNVQNVNETASLSVPHLPDTTQPTVWLVDPFMSVTGLAEFDVMVKFSEGVTGFEAADIRVTSGDITAFSPVLDTSSTYTFADGVGGTITSSTSFVVTILPNGMGNLVIDIDENAAIDRSMNGNTALETWTITAPDIIAPTATLAGPASAIGLEPFVVTLTTSELLASFLPTNIRLKNGMQMGVDFGDDLMTYTLTIEPDGVGDIEITILAGAFKDSADNPNTQEATLTVPYAPPVDTTPPTVAALTGPDSVSNLDPFEVTVAYSGYIDNYAEFEYTNVSQTAVNYDFYGRLDTLTITPDGNGDIGIIIAVGILEDSVGNTNTAEYRLTVPYTPPETVTHTPSGGGTITLTGPEFVSSLEPFDVTISISEVTSVDAAFQVTNDVSTTAVMVPNGYTLTIEPDGMGDIEITLPTGTVKDPAGTSNAADVVFTIALRYTPPVTTVGPDNTRPTVSLSDAPATVEDLGTLFTITMRFSEDVFELVTGKAVRNERYLSIGEGAGLLVDLERITNQEYTLTIMPLRTGIITVSVYENIIRDIVGNLNTASPSSTQTLVSDSTAPTVTLTAPDALTGPAPFEVTARFSEVVNGFDAITDIMVTNGTVAVPVAVGSSAKENTDYILTITPDGMGDISIAIPADVVTDGADNGNAASDTVTVAHTVDTTAPVVTLTGPASVTTLAPFVVTATLNEQASLVSSFIRVKNGEFTLGGSIADRVYRLIITPKGDDENIEITMHAGAFTDLTANTNTAEPTLTVLYDPTAPTATLTGPDFVTNLDLFDVTMIFSELISLASSDIQVSNGILPTSVSPNNVDSYTLSIKPNGNGDIKITIPVGTFSDIAGNTNTVEFMLTVPYGSPSTAATQAAITEDT